MDTRLGDIIKGVTAVAIYFLFSLFGNLPLELSGIDIAATPILFQEIYNISLEIIMIIIIIVLFKDYFKKSLTDLKKNHFNYFKKYLKYYILGVAIMMVCNSLIMALGGSTSDNETLVRNQFNFYPIYTFICAVFLAPILEESVFRVSFRKIFKNDILFILMSGLVFGGLHLIGMLDSPLILLYLGAYSALGFVFAFMLAKTDNVFVSMMFHFIHNGVLMSVQFLMFFLS